MAEEIAWLTAVELLARFRAGALSPAMWRSRSSIASRASIPRARFDEPRVLRAMRALEAADPPAWPHPRIRATLLPLGVS